ncbi:hypothetical protein R5A26_50755, partial [Streptomyces prunicolor]|nr:hypothetical protein [Streptomyces prunicolor]
ALAAACAGCVRGRTSVSLATFARLAGDGLRVVAGSGDPGESGDSGDPGDSGAPAATVDPGLPEGLGVPELVAEAALLQARLDWFQSRLARLEGGGAQQ